MSYLAPISPATWPDGDESISITSGPIAPHAGGPLAQQWTPPKMAEFLRQLAATHSVSAAARSVGMGRQSAYKLRARLKDQPFDLAWKCAFRSNYDALAQAALERAMEGVEVPHFYKGELIHTSRRYDERLTLALLAMRPTLAPTPVGPSAYKAEGLPPDDFAQLVDRVEQGPET